MKKLLYTVPIGFLLFISFSILGRQNSNEFDRNAFSVIAFQNEEYVWKVTPPNDAQVCSLCYIANYFLPESKNSDFKNEGRKIAIARNGNNIWLEMVLIRNNPWYLSNSHSEAPSLNSQWIEGRIQDDSRIAIQRVPGYASVKYSLWGRGPQTFRDRDTVYLDDVHDTLSLSMAILGENKNLYESTGQSSSVRWDQTVWEVNFIDDDMVVDFNPETLMICNTNHPLVIKSNYSRNYEGLMFTNSPYKEYLSTSHVRDEFAVRDFIIGKITESEPDVLPAPVVYILPSEHSGFSEGIPYHNYISDLKISLDLITEDSLILNYEKIHTVIYRNGEEVDNFVAFDGFSPFRKYPKMLQYVNFDQPGDIFEIECYYEREDGSRAYSPRVQAVDATGVEEIKEESTKTNSFHDGRTYDLTGREVNPDRLSPGIYIREGKKFIIATQ